jgi:hypothetical protein
MTRFITTLLFSYIALTSHFLVAEDRHIHVNGECLESTEMAQLDQLIGGMAPNGNYWIDFNTGAWGYEGDQETQGYISTLADNQTEPGVSTSSGQRPYMDSSITGRVVSGQVNGQDCTYVSVGGTSMRSCN